MRFAVLSIALVPASALQAQPLAARPVMRSRAKINAQAPNRYDDPILDESLPDPVYDVESGYLGKSPFGFSTNAEDLNGRAAMTGFTLCFLQEAITGKGVLELYGLPYDSGAVVSHTWEPSFLTGVLAFVVTFGLLGGLTFLLITLNGGFEKAFGSVKSPLKL